MNAAPTGAVEGLGARRLAVVTAYNPGNERPPAALNREANRRLERQLQVAGFAYYPAVGRSEDGSHREPSFAVLHASPAQAAALGALFRQACVLYWDGLHASLVPCNSPVRPPQR